MFDKDGSGVISADEIKEVLGFGGHLDNKAIDVIIKQVDEKLNAATVVYDTYVAGC